jgi:hypothetical protein
MLSRKYTIFTVTSYSGNRTISAERNYNTHLFSHLLEVTRRLSSISTYIKQEKCVTYIRNSDEFQIFTDYDDVPINSPDLKGLYSVEWQNMNRGYVVPNCRLIVTFESDPALFNNITGCMERQFRCGVATSRRA